MRKPGRDTLRVAKTVRLLIALDLLQVLTMLLLLGLLLFSGKVFIPQPYLSLVVILIMICMLTAGADILNAAPVAQMGQKNTSLHEALEAVEQLNGKLRAQRHDFLNHLQVVYSLIEMDSFSEAHRYIEQTYDDIQQLSGTIKTAHPAVNAILQAKTAACQKRGIQVELEIRSRLGRLPMEPWELCRVLGNVLDNAMHALADTPDPCIRISLTENVREYRIAIANNGPQIATGILDRIFEAGFSTAGADHGMGLAICRELVHRAGGKWEVASEENETCFLCILPRRTDAL